MNKMTQSFNVGVIYWYCKIKAPHDWIVNNSSMLTKSFQPSCGMNESQTKYWDIFHLQTEISQISELWIFLLILLRLFSEMLLLALLYLDCRTGLGRLLSLLRYVIIANTDLTWNQVFNKAEKHEFRILCSFSSIVISQLLLSHSKSIVFLLYSWSNLGKSHAFFLSSREKQPILEWVIYDPIHVTSFRIIFPIPHFLWLYSAKTFKVSAGVTIFADVIN